MPAILGQPDYECARRNFAENATPGPFAKAYAGYLADLLMTLDFTKIAEFMNIVLQARADGHRTFFIGNGGSAEGTVLAMGRAAILGLEDNAVP